MPFGVNQQNHLDRMRRRGVAEQEQKQAPAVAAAEATAPGGGAGGEEEEVILLGTMVDDNKVGASDQKPAISPDEDMGQMQHPGCCYPETSVPKTIGKLAVCVLAGLIFGLALEKGRVFEPTTIRNQMVFRQWTMLKMFIAAMAVGQLIFAIISCTSLRPLYALIHIRFCGACEDKGLLTSLLGPFILGVGMTFSGACPGMVLAQIGSWTKNSVFTFVGALVGALVYGMIQPWLKKFINPRKPIKYSSVQDHTGYFYAWFAFPMAILMIVAVVALEIFIPWHDDLPPQSRNPVNGTTDILGVFFMKAWMPSVCGALIGLLQLFVIFSVGDSLGSSTSYMTIVSQWVIPFKLQNIFPHLATYRIGISSWWQVFYVLAAMGGGFLSSFLSSTTGTTRGVSLWWGFTGGFLMLFGARLGGGCTSGHGLSGAALLVYISLLAVPVMFIGGIAAAFALLGFNLLDNYDCYGPCVTPS